MKEEIVELLSQEYGVDIEVRFAEEDRDEPILVCCGKYKMEEIPGEPGYLIEMLKKLLDKALMSGASQRPHVG